MFDWNLTDYKCSDEFSFEFLRLERYNCLVRIARGGCSGFQSIRGVIVILGSSMSTLASIYAKRATREGNLGLVSIFSPIIIVDDVLHSPILLI